MAHLRRRSTQSPPLPGTLSSDLQPPPGSRQLGLKASPRSGRELQSPKSLPGPGNPVKDQKLRPSRQHCLFLEDVQAETGRQSQQDPARPTQQS